MAKTTDTQQASDMCKKSESMQPTAIEGLESQASNIPLDLSLSKISTSDSGRSNSFEHLGKLGKALKAAKQASVASQLLPKTSNVHVLSKLASQNTTDATAKDIQIVHTKDGNNSIAPNSAEIVDDSLQEGAHSTTKSASTRTIFDPEFSVARTKPPKIELHVIMPHKPFIIQPVGFRMNG